MPQFLMPGRLCMYGLLLCLLALAAFAGEPATAFADEREPTVVESLLGTGGEEELALESSPPNLLVTFINMVLALALVLGLIYLLYWFLQKRGLRLTGTKEMRVLSSLPIGQQKALLLVEAAGKVYLLGVAESITVLDVLEEEERLQLIRGDGVPLPADNRRLLHQLKANRREWLKELQSLVRKDSDS